MHDHHEQNRRSWNAATPAHNRHKRDQAAFLRDGGTTLFADEIELLGGEAALRGRSLVHLQCNCGQDSLSLARLGATVTGVDIADAAVEFARRLSAAAGIAATFERDDVLEWLPRAAAAGRRFDFAFASYGAVGWIEDLALWARGVAGVLAPGGALALLEFHPLVWLFDEHMALIDDYFRRGPIPEAGGVGDYVARSGDGLTPSGRVAGGVDFANPEPAVAFQWTVADIVQAVIDAGLVVETLREYPHSNGCRLWPGQPQLPGRRFGPPGRELPLMLGLRARRPR